MSSHLIHHERGVDVAPFRTGDHLDDATFDALYEQAPEEVRAELIEGVVYVHSNLVAFDHADWHSALGAWIGVYSATSPGTKTGMDGTVRLTPGNRLQPDGLLIIAPEAGGQTHWDGIYLAGPPELCFEVAYSSVNFDLHEKKDVYERAGVREYFVALVEERKIIWFRNGENGFEEVAPGEDGVIRSEFFPGLWLDCEAVLRDDSAAVLETLKTGMETPDHAAFCEQLRYRLNDADSK